MLNPLESVFAAVRQFGPVVVFALLAVGATVTAVRHFPAGGKKIAARFREVFVFHPLRLIPVGIYIIACTVGWGYAPRLLELYPFDTSTFIYTAFVLVAHGFMALSLVLGTCFLVFVLGRPHKAKDDERALQHCGLDRETGEHTEVVSKHDSKQYPGVLVREVFTTMPLPDWKKVWNRIESALNSTVVAIEQGNDHQHILLYTLPPSAKLPERVDWSPKYLNSDNFVLTLGVDLRGPVAVDLANVPHILLGGSSGSGKSIMLKLLLMQCAEKGADVYLADFKGGVDFPTVIWHDHCRIVLDMDSLMGALDEIAETLKERKGTLLTAGCRKIDEYNQKFGTPATPAPMRRIVFACDEVAELLDKTGLSKETKDSIAIIESQLATIARQGRAFGIHLILATQRPDANILPGQIRSNIDCRICGRADSILSQIILDSAEASTRIPKDAKGRFLLNDGTDGNGGTLFQGFWFDDSSW